MTIKNASAVDSEEEEIKDRVDDTVLCSIHTAAKELGITCQTLRKNVKSGNIPPDLYFKTPGGHCRFKLAGLKKHFDVG